MSLKNKSFITLITLLILAFVFPWWFYYFKLPSRSEIQAGSRIEKVFYNFGIRGSAKISDKDDFDKLMCMECLPYKIGSDECHKLFSYFIAKNILMSESHNRMLEWYIRGAYLTSVLLRKYNHDELSMIYFAFIAAMFKEKEISSFCISNFKKNCTELTNDELVIFKSSTSHGRYFDKPTPPFDRYFSCLK